MTSTSLRHDSGIVAGADPATVQAVVVPHTHWDREWYAPFETMRFHLLRLFDELVETLETDAGLPVFLLDGQAVIVEDYLQIRRGMRERVEALVRAGRLRPGPFYVQPDEFHVSGESIVRNLLHGLATSRELGWVMREGYLPDTFGHIAQLPQILSGFGIDTFYAMRGFSLDVEQTGSELWWEASDGSRVLVEWLSESYSNAAVLTPDPATTWLHHGTIVRYDDVRELLERLTARSRTGVLLLLNGGDHLRVQPDLPAIVAGLDAMVGPTVKLGGLEEFQALRAARDVPRPMIRGELRRGARHDVFEGIASTRTPMKMAAERVQTLVGDVAERLDALAHRVDGATSLDALRHAWRELIKNHAHDSACGCCVDEVHQEMATRFTTIGQLASAVRDDALARIARAVAEPGPDVSDGSIGLVVVNASAHPRSGTVAIDVLPDLDAPLGLRRFGWTQGAGVDWSGWSVRDAAGRAVPFTLDRGVGYAVADPLDRRKELYLDRFTVTVTDLPGLSATPLRLVSERGPAAQSPAAGNGVLDNGVLRAGFDADGTVWITHRPTGRTRRGLLEFLEDADAGDTYGHGPLGDLPLTSRSAMWMVTVEGPGLRATATLDVPAALEPDRRSRSAARVPLGLGVALSLTGDRLEVTVTVDNTARDHRLRLRLPTGATHGRSVCETAFGEIARDDEAIVAGPAGGWAEQPTAQNAMRRYVAVDGLQVLTEGLYEYTVGFGRQGRTLDVTLLRGVGWLARTDTPGRGRKVGPEVEVPLAQCPGEHAFRLGLRPYGPDASPGHRHRAAEEFAVPLLGVAVQGRRPGRPPATPVHADRALAGVSVEPAAAVLTAFKVAEDAEGVVLRVVNVSHRPVDAVITVPGATFAIRCDLEETPGESLDVVDGRITVALQAGRIASVRVTS